MPDTPTCTLTPEQEEGPFYIDDQTLRQNITEQKPGLPLKLRIAIVDAKRCAPLGNAALDIWHCDGSGVYSGFTTGGPGGPGGRRGPGGPGGGGMRPPEFAGQDFGPGMPPPGAGGRGRVTDATRFLRGVQVTDKTGQVEFTTLYPGWYPGRAIHIHLKVHTEGRVCHTGQLFFPEDITEEVAKSEPYAKILNVRRTRPAEDGIYTGQHGSAALLNLDRLKSGSKAEGFLATVTLAVDPEATPRPVGGRGGRG